MSDSPAPVTPDKTLSRLQGLGAASRIDARWWLVTGTILLIIILVTLMPDPYMRIVRFVSDGIGVTLSITIISFLLTLVVGMIAVLLAFYLLRGRIRIDSGFSGRTVRRFSGLERFVH